MSVHGDWTDMPCVSRFHGIVITMFFNESIHPGRPHFHAECAGERATFDIESLDLIVGRLSRRANKLVLRWAKIHREELRDNWRLIRSTGKVLPIAPLN